MGKIFPLALSFTIILFTVFLAVSNYKFVSKSNQQYFDNIVDHTQEDLLKRYSLYEASLKGGLGLFRASEAVSRTEWKNYVETLKAHRTLPGINGLGYIDSVNSEDLENYLDDIRKNDYADFVNHPPTDFNDKFIIKYIEPETKNLKAIGLDIGFEKNRRTAAEKSRDTGLPQLTKKITLVQDDKKTPGFLMLVPFYKGSDLPKKLSEKRKNFVGWVYAPFIANNFFSKLDYADSKYVSFKVYDGQYATPENLIYQTTQHQVEQNDFNKVTKITIAGNVWTIKWQESELFVPTTFRNMHYYILFIGFIISLLAYFFLQSMAKQRDKIQKLVEKQTSELSDSQNFLHLIMNTIPDGVFVKDKNFRIIKANETFMNLYSPEKRDRIIGYTTVENFPEEEVEAFLKQDRIAFENGLSQVQENITNYKGQKISFLTTKVKFCDVNNEDYILGISRDVTDLINEQKNLELKVEERTKEYKEQKIIAEKAGEAKEEFLANMSHELRTPLNSIIGLTRIISNDGDLNKEQSEMINIVEKASDNLLQIVNDILDISKIESGNIEFESKTFSLSGLLHSIVDISKPLASQKGLLVKHNLSELEDVFIKGDEHRITRVITNLTSNAIKYTDEGEIEIKFGTIDQDGISVDFVCSVSDTGIGIPEDKINHIFDKFTQAKESTERLYGGTGLGLSITKQLVELMGGEITVKSEVGKGSTFTVRLPFDKSDKSEEDTYTKKPQDTSDGSTLKNFKRVPIEDARILIAEDHEFNKIFISKLLNRLGNNNFKVMENGLLALREYKKDDYDLILMDCNMPVMNGYEASRKIREYEDEYKDSKHVPISAMTADVMPATRRRCLSMGMNEYITKPLNEKDFRDKMKKWIIFKDENTLDKQEHILQTTSHVNLDLLDDFTGNDEEAKIQLIKVFYDTSLEDIGRLKKNCNDFQEKEWIEASHRLKGSSSYIGANNLKNLCSVAETSALYTEDERKDIYVSIKREYDIVCNILHEKGLLAKV